MVGRVKQILVVGAGNMGGALIKGLLACKEGPKWNIRVHEKNADRLAQFRGSKSVAVVKDLGADALTDDVIVFCIKPQDLKTVAAEIAGKIPRRCLVISVLAGKKLPRIANLLQFKGPIVRAMPNMAATVMCAATAMCANNEVTELHRKLAETIFNQVGEAYWTREPLMDTVTGLSGSGPAYIYMVIEALTDGGVKMGLPRELAAKLATQTVLGAATLVKSTGLHPAILKDQVSTPAGTTISALHKLEELGLRSMFVSAVEIATERSQLLGNSED